MRTISVALAVAGLSAGTLLVTWFGFDQVAAAFLSVGWAGFALLLAAQLSLFAVLGLAWSVVASRAGAGAVSTYCWGRMVRDAATNCLPFSPVGGFVLGARAVTLRGVPWPLATASVVVDVTAELLAQLAFALLGLGLLVASHPRSPLAAPLATVLACGVVAIGGFVWVQRGAGSLVARLGRRIARGWFEHAQAHVSVLQREVDGMYARRDRLLLSGGLHLLGWVGTAGSTWLAFRLLGVDLPFADALAIEASLRAILAAAFAVPGGIGVQEAGYAGLGALFGIPPEVSLGVSLLGRARDLAIGVPVLLLAQWLELRRLRSR